MRLINADSLKEEICKRYTHFRQRLAISPVFEEIEKAPSLNLSDATIVVRCKDCKHFEYNHLYIIQGIPVLGHEVCNAWGDGCKTNENGFCFMAERRTDE